MPGIRSADHQKWDRNHVREKLSNRFPRDLQSGAARNRPWVMLRCYALHVNSAVTRRPSDMVEDHFRPAIPKEAVIYQSSDNWQYVFTGDSTLAIVAGVVVRTIAAVRGMPRTRLER